ncbi:DNA anti-recombination protein RmuC [Loktanella ponticola]|uniref:DNA anti-recombination protein RmuC n=1 Tax=Yoonia ponticola TaxID=1524255 RepID=A0A7W9BH93_9RHOB|nr:hypothetical protein [Yoonia ponticola]MBB5720426.1 DNA anti-recombination protein RmuC [Yoonia ponticola]
MAFISDILMSSGAFGVALYCIVLSRRLKRFTNLESGIGKAINTMSKQIQDLENSLQKAQITGSESVNRLKEGSERAEAAGRHLELLVASLHSLPTNERQTKTAPANPFFARRNFDYASAE